VPIPKKRAETEVPPLQERQVMNEKEILKKIQRIEIFTNRLVNTVFAGEYESVFKGQGITFDEVREYQIGDEIRTIDWNVTARMGQAYVKKYVEERELVMMLIVDMSASTGFGSIAETKAEVAAEIAAFLAFSAIKNNDKVGLICFTDTVEHFVAPRKGKRHVLRVVRDILHFEPRVGHQYCGGVSLRRPSSQTAQRCVSYLGFQGYRV